MAFTLDKSRPFGTVTPIYEGAAFAQDGRHFGPDGKRVLLPGEVDDEPVKPKAAEAPRAPQSDKPAAAKPKGGRPKGSTNKPKPSAFEAPAPAAAAPAAVQGDVNLTAWATGKADYIMADVYKAIRARYSRNVTNEADAADALVEEGAVTAEALRRG